MELIYLTIFWYHLAWTRDGSGDNNLWLDGVNKLNWSNSNDQSLGTSDLIFGATNSGTGYIYNGYIDEVRLSSTERYTTGFTPHTQVLITQLVRLKELQLQLHQQTRWVLLLLIKTTQELTH